MSIKTPKWLQSLSTVSWVNSVAISNDGSRVVGASFIHDYSGKNNPLLGRVYARYGTFGYDAAGTRLWEDMFSGWDGIFAVGISGDGSVAAAGGIFTKGLSVNISGLLKIFDASNGTVLFDSTAAAANGINGRVNLLGLSGTGNVAAVAADQLHVFIGNGTSYVPAGSSVPGGDPDFKTALGTVAAVAVHPSGNWLAACNQRGQILVATIARGTITRAFLFKIADEPIDRASAASPVARVKFLSVAISAQSDAFVAGGCDVVYHGSLSDVTAGNPPIRYDAGGPGAPVGSVINGTPNPKPNVRWTAVSGDGLTFAAVANRVGGQGGTGQLLIYKKGTFVPWAKGALPHSPNGVSMDRAAQFIAVSDGYPVGKVANFYRFDLNGNEVWRCPTPNMNWPVTVSADGSAIAGGGDDGYLYYFVP